MEIYQGEPIGFKFNIKGDGEQGYLPSLEGRHFEALIASETNKKIKTWTTEDGSISFGVETVDDELRGFAAFSVSGIETADYKPGKYILELAEVLGSGDGRAIGKLTSVIIVKMAVIAKGV